MTYGQLKFRLTKAFPGVDADLIEGWIGDCHQEILGMLPWSRLDVQAILLTTAPYSAGTVAVTQASNAIALTGGTWTAAMTGTAFRVTGDDDEYEFTLGGSATSGTLDRPYTAASNAAAGYSIYQAVYPMPADCRFLDEAAFNSFERGRIRKLPIERGQRSLVDGEWTGVPAIWWPYMDNSSTPPQMQVKLYPIPDQVYGIPFTYCAEAPNPTTTSYTMLPWIQPAALIEGTTAKIKRHLKDYAGAQIHKAAFGDAVGVMMAEESYRRGPVQMQVGEYYTRHRMRRCR